MVPVVRPDHRNVALMLLGLADYLPAGFPDRLIPPPLFTDDGPTTLPEALFHDHGTSGTDSRTKSSTIMKYLALAPHPAITSATAGPFTPDPGASIRDHVIVDRYLFPAGSAPR